MVEAMRRHQRVIANGVHWPQSERLRRRQRWYLALMGVCLGAHSAGLEPGPVLVDDGSHGRVGRCCCAPTDRRCHRQLRRGPLTARVEVVMGDPPATKVPLSATCRSAAMSLIGFRSRQPA